MADIIYSARKLYTGTYLTAYDGLRRENLELPLGRQENSPTDKLSFQNSPNCDDWSASQNYINGQKLGIAVVDITTRPGYRAVGNTDTSGLMTLNSQTCR